MHLGQGQHRSDVPFSLYPMGHTGCLIAGAVDLSDLVKVVSAGFLLCKANIFLFPIYSYLGREFTTTHISYFSSNCHLLILVSIQLATIITVCANEEPILSFLMHLLIRIVCTMEFEIVVALSGKRFLVLCFGI